MPERRLTPEQRGRVIQYWAAVKIDGIGDAMSQMTPDLISDYADTIHRQRDDLAAANRRIAELQLALDWYSGYLQPDMLHHLSRREIETLEAYGVEAAAFELMRLDNPGGGDTDNLENPRSME